MSQQTLEAVYIYIYMECLFQAICLIKENILNLFKMGFVVISRIVGVNTG